MKKEYLSAVFALFSLASFGQNTAQVDANNVNATISDNGFFFNNSQTASPGYEVPAGSNSHAIYTGSFWFGGTDINGQLKLAAQQFESSGSDYTVGPTTRFADQVADAGLSAAYFNQTIWKVTRAEIDDHIANYQSSTYTMPNDIENWPAHGDTTLGSSQGMLPFIAPFVDVNGNGTYDPENGDYPCIKGDYAVYTIMNDVGLHFGSFGEPINMELHYMFYQYTSIPELENTTFIDVEVVNMGTQTLFDTRAAFFIDPDLGDYSDDYIGTDTTRNMVYVYNADDFDAPNAGQPGYGAAPPAVGLKVLSHDLSSSISYSNAGSPPMSSPSQSLHYYYAMNGNYVDNSDQLDGNGNPTDFSFYGDPNVAQSWSEFQQSTAPGDRRFVASLDAGVFGPDFSQGASDRRTYSYAVIYAKGTDHLNSVEELQSSADFIQNHYDNMTNNCFDSQVAAISEAVDVEFVVAPNPNNGTFTIQLPIAEKATAKILDAQGRLVHEQALNQGFNKVSVALESGVYFVQVSVDNAANLKRLVIR
ncbi:MAG: hypothetical protein Crog4KO_13250 [Crocinitomicaceae bacterium]